MYSYSPELEQVEERYSYSPELEQVEERYSVRLRADLVLLAVAVGHMQSLNHLVSHRQGLCSLRLLGLFYCI